MATSLRNFIKLFGYSLLCLCLCLANSGYAYAVGFAEPPPITNREKAHIDVSFTGGGDDSAAGECSEGGDSSISLSGRDNAEKVYNFMRSKGLSAEQAAGAWGNISVESASTFDPRMVQFGFTPARTDDPTKVSSNSAGEQGGWGIIQWTPANKVVQPDGGLMKKAGITSAPSQLGSQLALVWWHMNNTTPPGRTGFLEKYKATTTVEAATELYMTDMEAPGIPHLDDRIQRAKEALRKYGGGGASAPDSSSTSESSSSCDSGGGELVGVGEQPPNTIKKGEGWALKDGADYTSYACAKGSVDKGLYTHPIRKFKFRLCQIGADTVNAIVSGTIVALVQAAKKDGLSLTFGAFRSYEDQQATYEHNCSNGVCNPPTAVPGNSQHEAGLALDFVNCASHGTACFRWLDTHAKQYGYYNFDQEPWHWSPSGH